MDLHSTFNLVGVHKDLIRIIEYADVMSAQQNFSFIVLEGSRTVSSAEELEVRHIPEKNACNLSCAVDLVVKKDGVIRWEWEYCEVLSILIKKAAKTLGLEIEWGGDWKIKDGTHFQLPTNKYP